MFRWFVVMGIVLAGCADSHRLIRPDNGAHQFEFIAGDSICLALPGNGIYGDRVYQGSGKMVQSSFEFALISARAAVNADDSLRSVENSLIWALKNNCKFLIRPEILHWEDRATEWSAIPDQIKICMRLYEVKSGVSLDTTLIEASSGLATFGGDHPEDLLPKPVGEYVDWLVR